MNLSLVQDSTVGRGGLLVKQAFAGVPPVTAPDRHAKGTPANDLSILQFGRTSGAVTRGLLTQANEGQLCPKIDSPANSPALSAHFSTGDRRRRMFLGVVSLKVPLAPSLTAGKKVGVCMLEKNLKVLKKHITKWTEKYDMNLVENRETFAEWAALFRYCGDLEFATYLENLIRSYEKPS